MILLIQQRFQQKATITTKPLEEKIRADFNTLPLPFHWFYATDVPNDMPKEYNYIKTEEPKKFKEFSIYDCKRLEKAYQNLKFNKETCLKVNGHKIPVNEDHLFEVDLIKKQMKPIYWNGATYEIRRGTWFFDNGCPLSEELAAELEFGFLKLKLYSKDDHKVIMNSTSQGIHRLNGFKEGKLIVYGQEQVAYIINELYGGELQLLTMKKIVTGPIPGAIRVTRGFKQQINPSISSKEKSSLSKIFDLELNQMFKEKTSITSKKIDDEKTKQAMEFEIAEDYNNDNNIEQSYPNGKRKIDHLIFCIHGIGQMLGTKFQSVNFIHTINILRKNIKKVYSENKDFQKLLNEDPNCRIQVLPITWRHNVDFQTEKAVDDENTKDGKKRLPSLLDITIDEIKPLRKLLGSVMLDVLLYYEPRYFNQILNEVVSQANSIYINFKERNPEFNGKVSIVGHSLGSAIGFDILSLQPEKVPNNPTDPKHLMFEVNNYFAIGSPIGVFNLLKHKNIGSRQLNLNVSNDLISKPRVQNFYNIFHTCDPVGYRIEPLISPEFKEFQPEFVPFLIKDFNKQLSTFTSFHKSLMENASETWKNLTSNVIDDSINLSKLLKMISNNVKTDFKQSSTEISTKDLKKESKLKSNTRLLTQEQLEKLSTLNYNGRVDYALQQGYLDLTIISSIRAHVNYFEDENIAAFILKETLTNHETVKQKKVHILPEFHCI